MGTHPDSPTGDDKSAEVDEDDRVMLAIRRARVRAMIESGHIPDGLVVDDAGTGFVKKPKPVWSLRPLDPRCDAPGEPSLELVALIRRLLPAFDPESDRRWWLQVAEIVRRAGRTAEEMAAMGHDELVAFFRIEVVGGERQSAVVTAKRSAQQPATMQTTVAQVSKTATAEDVTDKKKSTRQILREWLDDPVRRTSLVAALSSKQAGLLIGRPESSVREAGDEWKELKREFRALRALRRVEKNRRSP